MKVNFHRAHLNIQQPFGLKSLLGKNHAFGVKNHVTGSLMEVASAIGSLPVLRGFRYALGMINFSLFRANFGFNHEDKPGFLSRRLGFSGCVLLASQEALGGLDWAWKACFSKHKMSHTAQGATLTK